MDHIVYLDHAATTKIDDAVLKEMLPYLQYNYGNASALYSLGRSSREAVENARIIWRLRELQRRIGNLENIL